MNYLKLNFGIENPEDWKRDVLANRLFEIGIESIIETDTGFEAFIPENKYSRHSVQMILSELIDLLSAEWSEEGVENKNWNEEWERNYFKPLLISDKCVVRAPFHNEFPKAEYEIKIEPNMAFGTGNHETTSMMMEALLSIDVSEKSVLDMGCGTGILAILAAMKGAGRILAIDIDENSFKGTQENALLNGVGNIEVKLGGAELLGFEKFNFILANIQRNVLLNDMEKYVSSLNPLGMLIVSGFYNTDNEAIIEKAGLLGLSTGFKLEKNNWVAQSFKKM
jgi:ribosomal protein L11 methyltransferase